MAQLSGTSLHAVVGFKWLSIEYSRTLVLSDARICSGCLFVAFVIANYAIKITIKIGFNSRHIADVPPCQRLPSSLHTEN